MSLASMTVSGAAWFEAIGWASLHASLLVGLVVLLQWALKRWLTPGWRYALWLLVVLRLVLPVVPASSFSVLNLLTRAPTAPIPAPSSIEPGLTAPPLPPVGPRPGAAADARPSRRSIPLRQAAASVWLAGMVVFLVIVTRRHRRISAWVNASMPMADGDLPTLLAACRAALRVRPTVTLAEADLLSTPAVFGVRRPRLLLPISLRQSLDAQELRLVFLHELMHLKRHDLLLDWLLVVIQAIHWFNPLVWFAFQRLRADRELACDAAVLRHLGAEERHHYGCTLIKLVEQFSPARLEPGLLSVLNTQTEIKRRILMISKFKPTPRSVTVVSALLLSALGLFTLTRAADRLPPPAEMAAADSEAARERQWRAAERGIKAIEEELAEHTKMIRDRQDELDKLKVELGVPEQESQGAGEAFGAGTLRRLESLRIEAQADYERLLTLYSHLTNLSRAEFKAAVATTVPDQLLTALMQQQVEVEQKMAEQGVTFAPKSPTSLATSKVWETIERQINERLDGILSGLKAKAAAEKKRVDSLQQEVEKYQARDIDLAVRRRPYFQIKRDLENLQLIRERLQARLVQEKINHSANLASAPSSTPDTTVDSRRVRTVSINADGKYLLGGRRVTLDELATALRQAHTETSGLMVSIRVSGKADYKFVLALLDRCNQESIANVSLLTEP